MDHVLITAFRNGYERMAAWSNLLDDINLYPVADADTGRNLRISLAPLKSVQNIRSTTRHLLMFATGNSGNIAGAFFSKFAQVNSCNGIYDAAVAGKEAAWNALQDPKPGTMLSVFDALTNGLQLIDIKSDQYDPDPILKTIRASVLSTADLLDELRQADVVDAGALGMFLFFEGFFKSLASQPDSLSNPYDIFGTKLKISIPIETPGNKGFCIDTVLIPSSDMDDAVRKLSAMGEQVVAVSDGQHLKVHLHAANEISAQSSLASLGKVLRWQSERIKRPDSPQPGPVLDPGAVHIVTDAAGSISAESARSLGITLLDSYIIMDDQHLPESMVSAEKLYGLMLQGARVTTAQASIFERHQHFEYLTHRFKSLLYLCVGSAYTGIYGVASRWAAKNRNERNGGPMAVMDTGAASGRLGLIARTVARYANTGSDLSQVERYACDVSNKCDEYVFLEQLKYLAAGGRLSKASGFIGDLLRIKPIIRPGAQGAQKVGVVKNQKAQVEFLIDRLRNSLDAKTPTEVLLQYTDNHDRVVSQIQPRIQDLLPLSRISVQPMSLTSGVHMGPGTWAVAFLPGGAPTTPPQEAS